MITVRDIEQFLYDWAPPDTAESWDNVGLLVGRPDRPVRTAHQQAHVVPALRRVRRRPVVQKLLNIPYCDHESASFFFSRAAMSSGSVPQSASSRLRCRPSSLRRSRRSCASR